jgi:co-chaperonin GroES (HSP10)
MKVTPLHDRRKYAGEEIRIDGEDCLILREDEVLAVIDTK